MDPSRPDHFSNHLLTHSNRNLIIKPSNRTIDAKRKARERRGSLRRRTVNRRDFPTMATASFDRTDSKSKPGAPTSCLQTTKVQLEPAIQFLRGLCPHQFLVHARLHSRNNSGVDCSWWTDVSVTKCFLYVYIKIIDNSLYYFESYG